jgi:glycosyltransferase involved in cell wall biosynthesis
VTLVCLAEIAWGYFRTRKQFLLSRLARDWRVIYFEPPTFGRGGSARQRVEDGVTIVTVPFPKPATTVPLYNAALNNPIGRKLIEGGARWSLSRWRDRLEIERPVCMFSNIYAANLVSVFDPRLIVYDFNDHPMQFPNVPGWAAGYLKKALSISDLVLAVSEPYRVDLSRQTDAPVITLENGVEYDKFAQPSGAPPEQLRSLPHPRVGYLGKLSTFLDLEILRKLADGLSTPLVLAGPVPPEMRSPLKVLLEHENVVYLGEIPYSSVPAVLAELDVGLIPFRAGDEFTRRINPNKLYQYWAAGLPIVSSPMDGIDANPPVLAYATDADGFLQAVGEVARAGLDRDRPRELARDHDWDKLAADLDALLREHLQEKEKEI